jgi:Holliday junction resolvase
MHGTNNTEFANAQKTQAVYNCKNTKEKFYLKKIQLSGLIRYAKPMD